MTRLPSFNESPQRMRAAGIALCIALPVIIAGCMTIEPQRELTPLELQTLQTREFQVAHSATYAATLSVFQDLGYVVQSADRETGFITARGSYKVKREDNFFGRLQDSGLLSLSGIEESFAIATAHVESITPERTRVRVNIVARVREEFDVMDDRRSSSSHAEFKNSEFMLTDADPYQKFFERLDQAIFIRQNSR